MFLRVSLAAILVLGATPALAGQSVHPSSTADKHCVLIDHTPAGKTVSVGAVVHCKATTTVAKVAKPAAPQVAAIN